MGVHLQNLTEQLGEYFGVSDGEGALVTEVVDESPAEKAGLKAGDVIVSFAGDDIDDVDELVDAVRASEVGKDVQVKVIRNKGEKTMNVQIGELPQAYHKPKINIFGLPYGGRHYDFRWHDDDLEYWDLDDLEDDLRRYRRHKDIEEDELKELKKHLKKLEREIEKMKDRL